MRYLTVTAYPEENYWLCEWSDGKSFRIDMTSGMIF